MGNGKSFFEVRKEDYDVLWASNIDSEGKMLSNSGISESRKAKKLQRLMRAVQKNKTAKSALEDGSRSL